MGFPGVLRRAVYSEIPEPDRSAIVSTPAYLPAASNESFCIPCRVVAEFFDSSLSGSGGLAGVELDKRVLGGQSNAFRHRGMPRKAKYHQPIARIN